MEINTKDSATNNSAENKRLNNARKSFETGEYLLLQTFQAINEPKLLVSILKNFNDALIQLIDYKLERARTSKEIPPYNKNNTALKIELFRKYFSNEYPIDKKDYFHLFELNKLYEIHKESAVEFERKNKYIITDKDMNAEELTERKVKEYYEILKAIFEATN